MMTLYRKFSDDFKSEIILQIGQQLANLAYKQEYNAVLTAGMTSLKLMLRFRSPRCGATLCTEWSGKSVHAAMIINLL